MIIQAKGRNGQITFDGDTVVISRKGSLGFLSHGFVGEKRIDISSITAIEFKETGAWVPGFIRFDYAGSTPMTGGAREADFDPNGVVFSDPGANREFKALRGAIEDARVKLRSPESPTPVGTGGGVAEELEHLASLRDRGILTADEFAQQKARVLQGSHANVATTFTETLCIACNRWSIGPNCSCGANNPADAPKRTIRPSD